MSQSQTVTESNLSNPRRSNNYLYNYQYALPHSSNSVSQSIHFYGRFQPDIHISIR